MKITKITKTFKNGRQTVFVHTEEIKKRIFRKDKIIHRIFATVGNSAGVFNNWIELPDKTPVLGKLSFQLDSWKNVDL